MEQKTPLTLKIRPASNMHRATSFMSLPSDLHWDSEHCTAGLPWLHGELTDAPAEQLRMTLRVHNRAGIPVIEGHTIVEAGQRTFIFSELRPYGIEAYAHVSEAEREQVAQRIWSRRAYGTIEIQPHSSPR